MAFMVSALHRLRLRLEGRGLRFPHVFVLVIARYYGTGNDLAALHATEAAIWAAAVWLGALGSLEAAILYSVNSMCTRGASGVMLATHWLMLGALEAADGMLLFGISTAFLARISGSRHRAARLHTDRSLTTDLVQSLHRRKLPRNSFCLRVSMTPQAKKRAGLLTCRTAKLGSCRTATRTTEVSAAHAGVAPKDWMRLTMVERRVRSEQILTKDGV